MDEAMFLSATASVDRTLAAIAWAEHRFPSNHDLVNNARIEEVILQTLRRTAGPDGDGEPGRNGEDAHLLLPSTGLAVPLAPDADVVGAIRTAAPTCAACDYCGTPEAPVAGLLPVVAPPQIVVLALCGNCIVVLASAFPHAEFVFQIGGIDQ
jgi:hypothetical protein